MKPEEQQIAIANACGIVSHDRWGPLYKTDKGFVRACPDYLTDLNAMHEAEQMLTTTQIDDYMWNLQKVCQPVGYTYKSAICATAAQRAAALLRTLNLWKE